MHNVVPPGQCSFVFRDFGAAEDPRVAWPVSIRLSERGAFWARLRNVVVLYLLHSGRVKLWYAFCRLAPDQVARVRFIVYDSQNISTSCGLAREVATDVGLGN